MVEAELHIALDVALLGIEMGKKLNVLDACTGNLGSMLQRSRLCGLANHVHLGAHMNAVDVGYVVKRRLNRLSVRNG